MRHTEALKLLRPARLLLASRGLCGQWLIGEPTVCAQPTRHDGPCGRYPHDLPRPSGRGSRNASAGAP